MRARDAGSVLTRGAAMCWNYVSLKVPEENTMAAKIVKTDEEWKKLLTPEQYEVTRKKGTERAFTGQYWDFHDQGIYLCVCCGNELFNSETKFDSG